MEGYMKWFDGLGKGLKILLSIFAFFCWLYRLFAYIRATNKEGNKLAYVILSIVPVVNFVIVILDIVAAAKGQPVKLAFGE